MTTKYDALEALATKCIERAPESKWWSADELDNRIGPTDAEYVVAANPAAGLDLIADVKALAEALSFYAEASISDLSSDDGSRARAALARIQGEAPKPANIRNDAGPRCSGCGSTDCNGECAGDDMMGDS